MSVPLESTKTGNRVGFVVKHTFIEVPGTQGEDTSPRRRSAPALKCMFAPDACDDDDSDEENLKASATRRASLVSFVSSVDSDDFIGAPSLTMSTEWSSARAEEIGSTCHSVDAKADIPWAPCLSSDSTVSSTSQTPWGPLSSLDSTLSSGSQLSWAPCSSAGSSYSSGNIFPSFLSALNTLQQPRQDPFRMSPGKGLHEVEQPDFAAQEPQDIAGDEDRTTIMVRNLATSLCQSNFVKLLNQRGYKGLFDFVYMPMNLREKGSFGYAFVNFTCPSVAVQFTRQLQSLEHDDKEWRVVWSTCQGMEANVERYRNSPLMHKSVPADCKPALYDERGIQVQFPAPNKAVPKPRIHHTKGKAVEKDSESGQMARDFVGSQNKRGVKSQNQSGKDIDSGRVWPSMSQMSANVAAHMVGHLSRVSNPR